jgi:hypothetical protein
MGTEAVFEATVQRRIEWYDTDAAGHHHYSVVLPLADAAEAELLRVNGLDWLFGRTPRVHQEVNYRNRLWFGRPSPAREFHRGRADPPRTTPTRLVDGRHQYAMLTRWPDSG